MAGSVVRAMKSQLQEEGGSTNVGRQISIQDFIHHAP